MILFQAEDAIESSISRLTYVNFQEVTLTSYTDSPPHNDYAPLDLRTRSWEVAREDVIVEKVIGKGAFGQVAKGKARNLSFRSGTGNIAIKMLKGVFYRSEVLAGSAKVQMMLQKYLMINIRYFRSFVKQQNISFCNFLKFSASHLCFFFSRRLLLALPISL